MDILMTEFTHLYTYPTPVYPQATVALTARSDGYIMHVSIIRICVVFFDKMRVYPIHIRWVHCARGNFIAVFIYWYNEVLKITKMHVFGAPPNVLLFRILLRPARSIATLIYALGGPLLV